MNPGTTRPRAGKEPFRKSQKTTKEPKLVRRGRREVQVTTKSAREQKREELHQASSNLCKMWGATIGEIPQLV
jgi:hypothetical protein